MIPDALRSASEEPRLSERFLELLYRRFGPIDQMTPANRPMYMEWWRDHAGRRAALFRQDLLWRLEKARPLAGSRVLDFGCGTGSSSVVIAERGASVVGIEAEAGSLELAVQRARDLGLTDRCRYLRIPYLDPKNRLRLPFRDRTFDVCTIIGVLEHMFADERRYVAGEIHRVLRPGGAAFVYDTPNRMHPFDHHTTRLWCVGYLPMPLARRYAIIRQRMPLDEDFQQRGATGISRWHIDRLFPPRFYQVTYDKELNEIADEFAWLGAKIPALSARGRERAGRLLRRMASACLGARAFGGRPSFWTFSHVVGYTKR